jgi:putative nucleotidyltransferase with HDIG domain
MMPNISRDRVLATCDELPAFPDAVIRILATLEDPDACLNVLSNAVEQDPVIAAQLLAAANRAGHGHGSKPVSDVFTAISLVGIAKVRELTTMTSVASFIQDWGKDAALRACWAHSLSVAVCSIEVALHTPAPVNLDAAQVAGLLHDVGRLWLHRFEPQSYADVATLAFEQGLDSEQIEIERFGVQHGTIGGWLARHWQLPADLVNGIEHHATPGLGNGNYLADIVHVGEVLCNALELHDRPYPRVSGLSAASCEKLGMDWGPDTQRLLGRIEARCRHTHALFDGP